MELPEDASEENKCPKLNVVHRTHRGIVSSMSSTSLSSSSMFFIGQCAVVVVVVVEVVTRCYYTVHRLAPAWTLEFCKNEEEGRERGREREQYKFSLFGHLNGSSVAVEQTK